MSASSISTWATIISTIVGIIDKVWGWFKGSGKSASSDSSLSIRDANTIGKTSADVARQTIAQSNKDQANVEADTASDVARLRRARGMRNKREIVSDAIRRANEDTGPDDLV